MTSRNAYRFILFYYLFSCGFVHMSLVCSLHSSGLGYFWIWFCFVFHSWKMVVLRFSLIISCFFFNHISFILIHQVNVLPKLIGFGRGSEFSVERKPQTIEWVNNTVKMKTSSWTWDRFLFRWLSIWLRQFFLLGSCAQRLPIPFFLQNAIVLVFINFYLLWTQNTKSTFENKE